MELNESFETLLRWTPSNSTVPLTQLQSNEQGDILGEWRKQRRLHGLSNEPIIPHFPALTKTIESCDMSSQTNSVTTKRKFVEIHLKVLKRN